jgi:hypothetical protein
MYKAVSTAKSIQTRPNNIRPNRDFSMSYGGKNKKNSCPPFPRAASRLAIAEFDPASRREQHRILIFTKALRGGSVSD